MIARILVVDDDPELRKTLREFLESEHHQVLEASDGAQAFAIAEKEMPHLVLLDIVMPGLYGSAALKRLRDFWRTSKIPVIVMSAYSDGPVRDLMEEERGVRFLRKPIDLAGLRSAIQAMLPKGGFIP